VEVEVEVAVLDPERQPDTEGHVDQPPAKRRQQVQTLGDQTAEILDRQLAAWRGRGVVHAEAADVAVGPCRLDGQELRIQAGELSHALPVPGLPASYPRLS
jgi:hypothetical protein